LWANLRDLDSAIERSGHALVVINKINEVKSALLEAEVAQRTYYLTRDRIDLKPFENAQIMLKNECEELATLIADNASQTAHATELCGLAETRIAVMATRVAMFARGEEKQALALAKSSTGWTQLIRFRDVASEMLIKEHQLHDQRQRSLAKIYRRADLLAATISLVTLITLCLSFGLIRRNVRQRESAEHALQDANATLEDTVALRTSQLSQLSGRLLTIAEKEKLELANELHDELGSNLTAMNLDVAAVANRLQATEPALAVRLQRALSTLRDTVELKRKIIHGLRPSMLDTLGLAPAVTTLCEDYTRRTGQLCHIDVAQDLGDIDPQWLIALYRIAQESLTNVTKHARAANVSIAVIREPTGIRLRIVDDGIGIDREAMNKPLSHGLRSMRERVRQCGGLFAIRPGENDRGTVVEAVFPFPGVAVSP
jgi:signal transduction histidine kinase